MNDQTTTNTGIDSGAARTDSEDPLSQSSRPGPTPDINGNGEGWIARLFAALRLRPAGSLRESLEDALAGDDGLAFSPGERAMLRNILHLRELRVDDVMVPRADIDAVDHSARLGEVITLFLESGHSRMPVYRETLDDPIGMIHIKDVMGHITRACAAPKAEADGAAAPAAMDLGRVDLDRPLSELKLVRPVLFVPPSMPAADLLAKMQANRTQMALVIDEYGGTDGLVSLEDLVETVVGDISDEHDVDEKGDPIVPVGEGVWIADGRADLEEVAEVLGPDFQAGEHGADVDTLGGFLFTALGRVPVRGELVSTLPGFEFEILDADPRRIKKLKILRRDRFAAEARRRRRLEAAAGKGESAA